MSNDNVGLFFFAFSMVPRKAVGMGTEIRELTGMIASVVSQDIVCWVFCNRSLSLFRSSSQTMSPALLSQGRRSSLGIEDDGG